jgi:hypothetical protein
MTGPKVKVRSLSPSWQGTEPRGSRLALMVCSCINIAASTHQVSQA